MANKRVIYIRIILCLSFIVLTRLVASAQVPGNWYSYYNAKKDLYGFKDAKGKVKISARFNAATRAWTFRNIIAVTDGNTNQSYYLLKNGKKVAKDSLYVWDMTYDCEQEGAIRFRDPVTDKVGFLGSNGNIIIPAVYNDAQAFHNGLALVIYNGKRRCADGTPYQADCEHWYWQGTTALINSSGAIVADSVDERTTENINWYSLKIAGQPADTGLYNSLKGKGGKYYTFINYNKEFEQWFYQSFLTKANTPYISALSFDEVTVEGLYKHTLRKTYPKAAFIKTFKTVLQRKMAAIKRRQVETAISGEDLNLFIYHNKKYEAYYTDCGEPNTAQYPLFEVITTHYRSLHQFDYQEHFSFLRTAWGYKLIAVALKNRK